MSQQSLLVTSEQQALLNIYNQRSMVCISDRDMIEVVAIVELTPIQNDSPAYLGLANRHGSSMVVFDLRYILNQGRTTDRTFIVDISNTIGRRIFWVG